MVAVSAAKEPLTETTVTLVELSFRLDQFPGDLPLVASCLTYPYAILTEQENSTGSDPNMVAHIGKYAGHDIEPINEDELLVTHAGIKPPTVEEYGGLPASGSSIGNVIYVTGSSAPKVSVQTINEEQFIVNVGDVKLDISAGNKHQKSFKTEFSYGHDDEKTTEGTVIVTAEHHGRAKIFGHPNNPVVPKREPWHHQIEAMQEGEAEEKGYTPMDVKEHDNGFELQRDGGP